MSETYPYQLVGFIGEEPSVGELVYGGKNGWYPQIALKRRFKVDTVSEKELIHTIKSYCSSVSPLEIIVGKLTKPERMPVSVLEVKLTDKLINFHNGFIEAFGENIISRFPERDGNSYYPHITAEYDGKNVINSSLYTGRTFTLNSVWLLKDVIDGDSQAYVKFKLSSDSPE